MRAKQTDPIRTRLSTGDRQRFEQICQKEGKTEAEIARAALLKYLDAYDQGEKDQERDRLADVLEKLFEEQRSGGEHLTNMVMRVMVDVGLINQVFYKRAAEDERDSLWKAAKASSVERLRHKRKGGDPEAAGYVAELESREGLE